VVWNINIPDTLFRAINPLMRLLMRGGAEALPHPVSAGCDLSRREAKERQKIADLERAAKHAIVVVARPLHNGIA
jgi:hypothetical protein